MKTFKKIDWILQLAFMIIPLFLYSAYAVARIGNYLIGRDIFFFYFGVGSWQIISMIIHFFFPSTVKIRMRKVYLILLSLTGLIGILSTLMGDQYIFNFLIGLLFWSPVLALIYLITCILETKKMKAILA